MHAEEDHHVTMKAEIRMLQQRSRNIKDDQQPQRMLGEGHRADCPLGLQKKHGPADTYTSDFYPPEL